MEDFLKRLGYSIARGVPQAATGFVDLAALPFTMSGMIKPEDVFLSTDYLTQKGLLPKPEQGLLNQTTELLSSAISPAAATKGAILATGGLLADAARFSDADLTPVGSIKIPKGLMAEEPGITAYHGSPYDFDKFKLSKVGKGEGMAQFGDGLYFSDAEDVAKFYRDELRKRFFKMPDGKISQIDVYGDIERQISKRGGSLEKAIDYTKNKIETLNSKKRYQGGELVRGYEQDLQKLQKLKDQGGIEKIKGSMYEVQLGVSDDNLIHWDKPLNEQPQAVQDFYKKFRKSKMGKEAKKALGGTLDQASSGEDIYGQVAEGAMSVNNDLRKELLSNNIQGIKYKAGQTKMSTDKFKDSAAENFVIFDDKNVNIKRKYELGGAGLAGLLGYQLLDDEDEISLGQIRI